MNTLLTLCGYSAYQAACISPLITLAAVGFAAAAAHELGIWDALETAAAKFIARLIKARRNALKAEQMEVSHAA